MSFFGWIGELQLKQLFGWCTETVKKFDDGRCTVIIDGGWVVSEWWRISILDACKTASKSLIKN